MIDLWDYIEIEVDYILSRWPPHTNILYPFVTDKKDNLKEAANLAAKELSKLQPFEVVIILLLRYKASVQ